MSITGVTRRALSNAFRQLDWSGELGELDFLSRLYDLRALPSLDPRFDCAYDDVFQHRVSNPDDWPNEWPLDDARFGLSDDERLLRFLAETVHPEVLPDQTRSTELASLLNEHLRPDGIELAVIGEISGRPVFGPRPFSLPVPTARDLRERIGHTIAEHFKSYEIGAFGESLGLEPEGAYGESDDPHLSKRAYMRRRLSDRNIEQLISVARSVIDRTDDPELTDMVAAIGEGEGVAGHAKYLIFAADGPKPDVVFRDAINVDLEFVGEPNCLVYDQPIESHGLSWREVVSWWRASNPAENDRAAGLALYRRFERSLAPNSPGEANVLWHYSKLYGSVGVDIPALLPQVYLHFDPRAARSTAGPLVRQRMDFLMLLPNRRRIVIEVDGKHHYADDDGRGSPSRYAAMVSEDRKLRLAGYEVYRFGATEVLDRDSAGELLGDFFAALFDAHGIGS